MQFFGWLNSSYPKCTKNGRNLAIFWQISGRSMSICQISTKSINIPTIFGKFSEMKICQNFANYLPNQVIELLEPSFSSKICPKFLGNIPIGKTPALAIKVASVKCSDYPPSKTWGLRIYVQNISSLNFHIICFLL